MNHQLTTQTRIRFEGPTYAHFPLRQGHTNRGQLLGANTGVGPGAASTVSWTRYSDAGRTTLSLRRTIRGQRGMYYETQRIDPRGSDVLAAVGAERLRFGRRLDLGLRLDLMREFNRNFADDASNVNLQLFAHLRRW